jgi:hypothetical protein
MKRDTYLRYTALLLFVLAQVPVHAAAQSPPRITRQQLRQMVKSLAEEKDYHVRKAKIKEIHETYGKP